MVRTIFLSINWKITVRTLGQIVKLELIKIVANKKKKRMIRIRYDIDYKQPNFVNTLKCIVNICYAEWIMLSVDEICISLFLLKSNDLLFAHTIALTSYNVHKHFRPCGNHRFARRTHTMAVVSLWSAREASACFTRTLWTRGHDDVLHYVTACLINSIQTIILQWNIGKSEYTDMCFLRRFQHILNG